MLQSISLSLTELPFHQSEIRCFSRYRQQAVPARVRLVGEERAEIKLATPQFAVAPGQGAVLYDGARVLGGGIIDGRSC